jgi:hypothetical protein
MLNIVWNTVRICAGILLIWSSAVSVSRAAPGTSPERDEEAAPGVAAAAARSGMGLASTLPATADPEQRAMAIALGGYDTSSATGIARFIGEVHLFGPLDLRLGLTYLSDVDIGQHALEPQIGLRLRILQQSKHGIDLATAVFYRRDRYASDEGMIQLSVAISRRWDRLAVIGNLAYGQDPEGDDRDADAALALLYELATPVQVGIESHLRFDVASDDPRRRQRQQGPLDLQSGALLHYSFGPAILIAQAGVSAYRFEHTRAGVYALGGIGGMY